MYSIIIPAYNEEEWLSKSLEAVKTAMLSINMPGEIIVTDNNSTDRTSEIALRYGAKVIFEPVNQISRARNTGAKSAQGKYFIFLDADTLISPELLQTALHNLVNGTCCGGGAMVAMDRPLGLFAKKFFNLWIIIAKKYQIASGCFVYCLGEAFAEIKGFNEKLYASEEVWFSRNLKKWGRKHNLPFKLITNYQIITSSRKLKHSSRLIIATITGILFPFAAYFRTLCWFWYKRPKEQK